MTLLSRYLTICLTVLVNLLVMGCGQSGPLYLPDQVPPITTAPCPTCPTCPSCPP